MRKRRTLGQPPEGACSLLRITASHETPDPKWDKPIVFRAKMGDVDAGYLEAYRYPEQGYLKPALIEVNPNVRRCGVNTKLHDAAGRYACDNGLIVISDQNRTDNTEYFWQKLVKKGKATCIPGRGIRISDQGDMDEVIGSWPCERFHVPRCLTDFSGPRRKR